VARKKFVSLCTNALLLEKKLDLFEPSPYLFFSVHLDGLKEHHDRSVSQEGVFERALSAIKAAKARGFIVNVNATIFDGHSAADVAAFLDLTEKLGVGVSISPGYAYERAPDQDHFLSRRKTKELFRQIFELGRGKGWNLLHSTLYLDFLAGNQSYHCTPWGMPTRNIFGWQKPCYLLGEGYVNTFKELMETTDWDAYGTGRYEKCANCMAHCGYEPTAADASFANPLKALWITLRGVRTLHARTRVHAENTAAVVQVLNEHAAVRQVYYPGLAGHPGHDLARRQQSGFGAMLSFELNGGEEAVRAFLEGLQCFTLAESLGGVESLIAHPTSMTHAGMDEAARLYAGIGPGLLRVSVGIEDADDLVADLKAGLERALKAQPAQRLPRPASTPA